MSLIWQEKVINEFGRDKKITFGHTSSYTQTLRTTRPRFFAETVLYNSSVTEFAKDNRQF